MKKTKILFFAELLFNFIIAIFLLVNSSFKKPLIIAAALILFLLLGWNLLKAKSEVNQKLAWANLLLLPVIFYYCLNSAANTLLAKATDTSLLIAIIYSLLLVFYLIPIVLINAGLIKNKYARLFVVAYLIVVLLYSEDLRINDYLTVFTDWHHSEILNGLALIAVIFCLFKKWNIGAKLDLKFKLNSKVQLIILLVMIAFTAWYSFFHSYVEIAPTFSQLFWNWDLSQIMPTQRAVLWSLGAIFFEEVFRYLLIIVLLEAFKGQKGQIALTTFVSALFYSLTHYTGLLAQAPVLEISAQAIFAFGYGCFLAALYLYSGKFWLLILSHFSLDFIAFSISSGGGGILSWYGNNDLLSNGLSAVVALVMTLVLLLSKQRKVMQENADRLIGE